MQDLEVQYKFQFQLNQISTTSKNTRLQSKSYMRPPCPWSVLRHLQGGSHQGSLSHQSRCAYLKPRTLGSNKANMAKQQEKSIITQATSSDLQVRHLPTLGKYQPTGCQHNCYYTLTVNASTVKPQSLRPHMLAYVSTSETPHVSISFNLCD